MSGYFITLEGGEGSGKTSVLKSIVDRLISEGYGVILTREPGGTKISEKIRDLILDTDNKEMDPWTEALLYAASRRQHVIEKILPALNENKIVICDRFIDSSFAYQGCARNLGIENIFNINKRAISYTDNLGNTDLLWPDLTIYLDIDPMIAQERIKNRDLDRLEQEGINFHRVVRSGYKSVYKSYIYSPNMVLIDASRPLQEVIDEVYNLIKSELIKVYPN